MPKETKINPAKFLEHAEAHCKFGSNADNTIREADPADLEAATIMASLRNYIERMKTFA